MCQRITHFHVSIHGKSVCLSLCFLEGVRSAMCAACQLPGRGPTDVDVASAPAR